MASALVPTALPAARSLQYQVLQFSILLLLVLAAGAAQLTRFAARAAVVVVDAGRGNLFYLLVLMPSPLVLAGLVGHKTMPVPPGVIPFSAASRHPVAVAAQRSLNLPNRAAAAVAAQTDILLTTTIRLEHPATLARSRPQRASQAETPLSAAVAAAARVQ